MYRYLIIFLFLIIIFLYLRKTKNCEKFEDEKLLIPYNELDDDLNILINKDVIKRMEKIRAYINDNTKEMPYELNILPYKYKIRTTFIQILYEIFVDDFLDTYIVNRFNGHTLFDFKYRYPSYKDINLKYPNDKVKQNYEKIFSEYLNPSIEYLFKNIDNNLDIQYFMFSLKDTSNKDFNYLNTQIKDISLDNFKQFYESTHFRNYIKQILKNLNIQDENTCKNEYHPFTFKFKELTDTNISNILSSVEEVIQNENKNRI